MCVAAAKEISIIVVASRQFKTKSDGIFTLKDKQRTGLNAFLGGKHIFALLPTGIGKSFVTHHGATPICHPLHQLEALR